MVAALAFEILIICCLIVVMNEEALEIHTYTVSSMYHMQRGRRQEQGCRPPLP
jgi:hypothetical protein